MERGDFALALANLAEMPPHARGQALEGLVAEMFRTEHFTVIVNSTAAKPRQTDVLAVKVGERYLIECKWHHEPAGIEAIDNLRARLGRTSGDVIGVLVSMTGFTAPLIHDVESHRREPILLVSGDELRGTAGGFQHTLPDLLYRKKESLLRDAHVLIDEYKADIFGGSSLPYPSPGCEFVMLDGARSHVFECGGEFSQTTFSHKLEDIDWSAAGGAGVALDLELQVGDERELATAVTTLVDLGWATKDARWSIQQATRNWHGLGTGAFLDALPHWRDRAEHHTEQVIYTDRCDNGFYTLTADVDAHRLRRVTHVAMSFQLQGVPLDSAPLLHLCRTLGVHDGLHSRPRGEPSRRRVHFRDIDRPEIAVLGYLVSTDSFDPETVEWVTGIIVRNPLASTDASGTNAIPPALDGLRRSEYLLCDLRHHHVHNPTEARSYRLHSVEYAWSSDAMVCRPVADWESEPEVSL